MTTEYRITVHVEYGLADYGEARAKGREPIPRALCIRHGTEPWDGAAEEHVARPERKNFRCALEFRDAPDELLACTEGTEQDRDALRAVVRDWQELRARTEVLNAIQAILDKRKGTANG